VHLIPTLRRAWAGVASLAVVSLAVVTLPQRAQAQSVEDPPEAASRPLQIEGKYIVDVIGVAAGGERRGAGVLDNAELTADADLGRLVGWRGARAHVHLLSNQGRATNMLAGTVQGIDNIEVTEGRAKLYEVWVEQMFAGDRAGLLVGLSDLNADFYQNDSAGMLIAPAFGIGSELAATGPNGPSIFPSTALTARLNVAVGKSGYVRAAVVAARAGVLGDASGIDFSMRDGALVIAEAGTTRGGKLAVGAWRYTRRQDDLFALDAAGNPLRRIATGAYLLVDQRVAGDDTRGVELFLRAGISEGQTTPFRGGFQSGVLVRGYVPGRPDGQFAFGVAQGVLSHCFRATLRAAGSDPSGAETGFEISYQDRVAPWLSVQPDVQYIRRAYAESGQRGTLVLGFRMIAEF
jgi:porin